jgi:hypothetical protein
MTVRIGTIKQKGTSLIDFLSILAIMLVLVAIVLSYSATDADGVFDASPSGLRGAASCRPTSTNACLPKQVPPRGMKEVYAFVQLTDGRAVLVRYSIEANPVPAGMIDRHMSCSGMSGSIPYSNKGDGCTSATVTSK